MGSPRGASDPFGFDGVDLATLRRRRSMKWRAYPPDVLPAWVAEMDVGTAPVVAAALAEAVQRGDLGYAVDLVAPELTEAFQGFAQRRWGWSVEAEQVVLLRDVMCGVELWIESFTAPGEGVVVPTPVYYPFLAAVRELGRELVEVPMATVDGRSEFDLDALEAAFRAGHRLLLLCNPHNPLGRAYSAAELRGVAELVDRYDVRVVADEIHAPLVFAPARHLPFAALGAPIAARTVTLHSASKAFNLAGLHAAVAVVGNRADAELLAGISYRHRGAAGILGIEASVAAYAHGDAWLDALLAHLERVRSHLATEVGTRLPGVTWRPPEATYLAWLDCRALDLGPPLAHGALGSASPKDVFLERGRVALNDGADFGSTGGGFVRLNFATSRPIVTEIVTRMAAALP